MDKLWELAVRLITNISLTDIGVLIMLFIIKFNDLRHLELHARIIDSQRVKDGKMSKEAYYFAHRGTEPLDF